MPGYNQCDVCDGPFPGATQVRMGGAFQHIVMAIVCSQTCADIYDGRQPRFPSDEPRVKLAHP